MSMSDPVADMLTRIRNAQMVGKLTVSMPSSKLKCGILDVLSNEGYIAGYEVEDAGTGKKELTVTLKYFEGKPVIEKLERVSRPSLRVYRSKDELPNVMNGLGTVVMSTSQGIVSGKQAQAAGQGGEVICTVY